MPQKKDLKKTTKAVEEKVAKTAKAVTDEVKTAARKAAPAAKKAAATAAKKASKVSSAAMTEEEIYIEFGGKSVDVKALVDQAKKAFKDEHKRTSVKKVQIYVKPETGEAYYVINDLAEGKKIGF